MLDGGGAGWREIDRELRRVAKARAVVDADEMRWLARAQEVELHRELGMATMLEYIERVLGYGPKVGLERLRVARELTELSALAAALGQGSVSFSAVRELSRKVTPETEEEWLEATRGMCLREIEDKLSGHKKGNRPSDPVDPDLRLRKITLELTPPTMALFRDACRRLEAELGHPMTDDEIMLAMCATVLGGVSSCGNEAGDASPRGDDVDGDSPRGDKVDGESAGNAVAPPAAVPLAPAAPGRKPATPLRVAPYQIALTVCPSCDRGWHDASGRTIAIPDSTIEQALCDAQYIGRTDLGVPVRADQEIPPAVARMVVRRDRGGCRVPGCRSARFAHHQALHQGKIAVTGTAPDALVFDLTSYHPDEVDLVVTHTAAPRPSNLLVTRAPPRQPPAPSTSAP